MANGIKAALIGIMFDLAAPNCNTVGAAFERWVEEPPFVGADEEVEVEVPPVCSIVEPMNGVVAVPDPLVLL